MNETRCLACMAPLPDGADACPSCGSPVPCAPNPQDCLPLGYVLSNRFTIGRVVHRGRYAVSYAAFDHRLQATRCIREFFPQGYVRLPDMSPMENPDREEEFNLFLERFQRKARIMAELSSDKSGYTVDALDQLILNGTAYMVMEYLEGCTVDEWLVGRGQALSWQEAAPIVKSMLMALDKVHRFGYLHRNLSLSNLFLSRDGKVRLIGFSSAERMETARSHPEQMWIIRKRYYSPPEQVQNGAQGPWTDTYAAGVCMFKLLAGGWPVSAAGGEPFPSLNALGIQVPEAIDRVVARALIPDPKKRFQSATEMLEAISRAEKKELTQSGRWPFRLHG